MSIHTDSYRSPEQQGVEYHPFSLRSLALVMDEITPFPYTAVSEQSPLTGYDDMYEVKPPQINPDNPFVFLLVSPSGTGQDALMDTMATIGLEFARIQTATTRKPREGESPAAYVWMDIEHTSRSPQEIMAQLAVRYGLVECQSHCGEFYGTPLDSILDAADATPSRPIVIKNECGGAKQMQQAAGERLNIVTIAIVPESYSQLVDRIGDRKKPLQRLLDAHTMATEIPYVANYVLCNRVRRSTEEGLMVSADQLTRLIKEIMENDGGEST